MRLHFARQIFGQEACVCCAIAVFEGHSAAGVRQAGSLSHIKCWPLVELDGVEGFFQPN